MRTYNDVFVEELVVRQRPGFTTLVRVGTAAAGIVLIVLFYYLSGLLLGEMGNAVFPALFALVCIAVFFAFRYIGLEYEYSFFSGDVDIDKIIGKRKRTNVMSFNCRDVEIMAPYGPRYESVAAGKFDQTVDARGNGKGRRDWFLVCRTTSGKRMILAFSPSDRLVGAFKQFVKRGSFKEE